MTDTRMNLLGSAFHQIAYVTNDFDLALDIFRTRFGVTRFLELRDIRFPLSNDGKEARCHIALARSGGLEIELITPIGGADLYSEPVAGPGFRMAFHHVAQRLPDLEGLEAVRAQLAGEGHRFPVDSESNGMTYFYADMRDTLGHYIEYVYATPEYWAQVGAAIPQN